MLKEITGDLIEDEDIKVIIREGFRNVQPDTDLNRRIFEKYPRVKENEEESFEKYGYYGSVGSMEGVRCDDGRMVITWNIGNDPESVELDELWYVWQICLTNTSITGVCPGRSDFRKVWDRISGRL